MHTLTLRTLLGSCCVVSLLMVVPVHAQQQTRAATRSP